MIFLTIVLCAILYIIISAGVYAITQRVNLGIDKTDDIILLAAMLWPLSVLLAIIGGIFYYSYHEFKSIGVPKK